MQASPGSANSVFTCSRESSEFQREQSRIRNSRLIYRLPLPSYEIKSSNAAVSQDIKLLTAALIVSCLPARIIRRFLFAVFLCDFYAKRLWSTLRYCTVKSCDSLLGFLPLIESISGQIRKQFWVQSSFR